MGAQGGSSLAPPDNPEYGAKRRPAGEYDLKVPYRTDEDLDKTMEDLLREIDGKADLRNCFSESDARLEGTERYW